MKIIRVFLVITLSLLCVVASYGQAMKPIASKIEINHVKSDFSIARFDDVHWKNASQTVINKYWSDEPAPVSRHFSAKLLWSDTALYVRFDASQSEPLVMSEKPDVTKKIRGLWDRDVCEIFIAPDASQRNKYFEFEIAPNGEWIDLGIEIASLERKTDWDYRSGMTSAAKIEKDKVVMAIKIPFTSLGRVPKIGDVWLGNLFRCVGKDPTRGYLTWQPTKTPEAAFHVPAAFGEFEFVK